jgi:hypothetical protein
VSLQPESAAFGGVCREAALFAWAFVRARGAQPRDKPEQNIAGFCSGFEKT